MLYEVKVASDVRKRRESQWLGILLHHTSVGGRKEVSDDLWAKLSRNITDYLCKKDDQYVSAHYTIWRDGKISQLVDPDFYEAFHAGKSQIYNNYTQTTISDLNRYMIGIELVGDGMLHRYSDAQYDSLISLCKHLKKKYPSIHPLMITGHENVAVPAGRKNDPGVLFDWSRFFEGLCRL